MTQSTFPASLLARMEEQTNGCIHYTGCIDRDGYGRIKIRGRSWAAHRAAYEHFVGPIPDGLTIDHECHNAEAACAGGPTCLHRRCVNPVHLAVKTTGDNSNASPNSPSRKPHCPNGHPYSEQNTRIDRRGVRRCLVCLRAHWEKSNASREL